MTRGKLVSPKRRRRGQWEGKWEVLSADGALVTHGAGEFLLGEKMVQSANELRFGLYPGLL